MDTNAQINQELKIWLNFSVEQAFKAFLNYVQKCGLSLKQMNVLMFVYYQGPCETTRLTEPMQATKSAVSQVVERMVQQGYLIRLEKKHNRRSKFIQLTPHARGIVENGIQVRQAWLQTICQNLPKAEQERLLEALTTINQLVCHPILTPTNN